VAMAMMIWLFAHGVTSATAPAPTPEKVIVESTSSPTPEPETTKIHWSQYSETSTSTWMKDIEATHQYHRIVAGNSALDSWDLYPDFECRHDDSTEASTQTDLEGTACTSYTGGAKDIAVSCCALDGSSGNRDGCVYAATYEEAKSHCEDNGYRLCYHTEMYLTARTGCGFDCRYSWVKNMCNVSSSSLPAALPFSKWIEKEVEDDIPKEIPTVTLLAFGVFCILGCALFQCCCRRKTKAYKRLGFDEEMPSDTDMDCDAAQPMNV